MTDIDTNIDSIYSKIYSKIKPLQNHPSFQNLNEKLKVHIELFNKTILSKKEFKYLRDKHAFEEGKAYKWSQSSGNKNLQRKPAQYVRYSDVSDSSSVSSHVSHTNSKQTRRTRKPKRRQEGDHPLASSTKKTFPKSRLQNPAAAIPGSTTPAPPSGAEVAGSVPVEIPLATPSAKIPAIFFPKNQGNPPVFSNLTSH